LTKETTRNAQNNGGSTGNGETAREPTRAIVVVPVLPQRFTHGGSSAAGGGGSKFQREFQRSDDARLEEAEGLARAIDLDIVHSDIVQVSAPRPATLLGTGKVAAIGEIIEASHAELVIVDHSLTPVQQRNLEKEWNAKVLDRTGLILEIFGRRAQTKEGALQVELAHLTYQKGRLVRSWTHLERQRGGGGFLGGPGETQIEADRRALQEKILRIKRELETVVRTRTLHRAKRKKVPHPVVALVGYTNAGKSTLFNRLTGAGVVAEDMLFATLDPTLRRIKLEHGETIILSDTVGFISNLPTHLVAAFRATLEEVVEADLILHVRDISDPDTAAQAEDVHAIMESLGIERGDTKRIIEVWNKIDLLDDAGREAAQRLSAAATGNEHPIPVSAITGEGVDALLKEIEDRIAGKLTKVKVTLQHNQMRLMDWIYQHSSNVKRKDLDDGSIALTMDMTVNSQAMLGEKMLSRNHR
jgi:GTP-binding protein HflX